MNLVILAPIGAVVALLFALITGKGVMKKSEGSEKDQKNCRCDQAGGKCLPKTPV